MFQARPVNFFKRGRVFAVGQSSTPADSDTDTRGWARHTQRFVIIAEEAQGNSGYCYVLPISTYGGSGVAKSGTVKADHGIIFSGNARSPNPNEEEEPRRGEEGMCATALRVKMRDPSERLHPASRVNYRTVRPFDKGGAVRYLGDVEQDSLPWLVQQFQSVQRRYKQAASSEDEDEAADEEDEDETADEEDVSNELPQRAVQSQRAKDACRRDAQVVASSLPYHLSSQNSPQYPYQQSVQSGCSIGSGFSFFETLPGMQQNYNGNVASGDARAQYGNTFNNPIFIINNGKYIRLDYPSARSGPA